MGCNSSTAGSNPTESKLRDNNTQQQQAECEQRCEDGPADSRADSRADSEMGCKFTYLQNVALFAHNHYREMHGAPPLRLSEELCAIARVLAIRMSKSGEHDPSPPEDRMYNGVVCGENLFWKEHLAMPPNGDEAVKSWYSEKEHFSFDDKLPNHKSAQFSQLVWAGSKELGIAGENRENGTAVIAVYYPPGNIEGQYTDNVKLTTSQ